VRLRRILWGALAVALLTAGFVLLRELRVATGYAAKLMCSGVFVAGRPQESLLAEDLDWFWWVRPRADREQRTASSSLLGLARSTWMPISVAITLLVIDQPSSGVFASKPGA